MAGGSIRCPRCKNSFLPLSDDEGEGEVCPHCGAEIKPTTNPLPLDDTSPRKPVAVSPLPITPNRLAGAKPRGYELPIALALVGVIGLIYWLLSRNGVPRASSAVGYTLGIVGFLLMLSTETLYTLRKRLRGFSLWRMSTWLKIHIVTGIVGSCLVLLHSGGKFHGLAGILAALTVVIVASGFIGRYIYTAVPRTLDGVEIAVRELEEGIAETDRDLAAIGVDLAGTEALAIATEVPRGGWLLVLGRGVLRWKQRRQLRLALRPLQTARVSTVRLERLLMERHRLQIQIASLAMARRLLALWHVMHIPLGAAVFTLAFIHIVAALYYTALVK